MNHKTPYQADLLLDTGPASERDERFAGVHLVDVDEDGEGKTTAERTPGGWQIREWELTDALDGALGPHRYWFARWSYQLPDKILASCVNLLLLEKLGPDAVPPLPAPEAKPVDASQRCGICDDEISPDLLTGTTCTCAKGVDPAEVALEPGTRHLEVFDLLYCTSCKGEDGRPLQYRGGSVARDLPDGKPGCMVCGRHLDDLPF